jgi:hypothetical protein
MQYDEIGFPQFDTKIEEIMLLNPDPPFNIIRNQW